MTNGPTGIQVAPITEDDMNRVQTILKRAMDGMIGMSQLAADVDMLRQTVASLQADAEAMRQRNANLDETLSHVRQERDGAKLDATRQTERADSAELQAKDLQNQVSEISTTNAKLRDDYNSAVQGWNAEYTRANKAEEALKEAQAKLNAIASTLGSAMQLTQPDPPVQAPHPLQVDDPHLPASPTPSSIDWAKPYYYDEAQGCYVNDPEPAPTKPDGDEIPF